MSRMKEVTALKDVVENLNTRKSTINWVKVFENWCDKNGIGKNITVRQFVLSCWIKYSSVFFFFLACMCKQDGTDHDCEHNLSPIILKGNQMIHS